MFYYRRDNAKSTAVEPRAVGGDVLTIAGADAAKFGAPTEESNMRLSVFDADGNPKTVLLCDGRSGTSLSIVGPHTAAGYEDVAVEVGDIVACVVGAADFQQFHWATTDGITGSGDGTVDDPWVIGADTDYLATRSYLATALALKQDKLPTGGTSAKFLRGDLTWQTPPAPDLSGYATTATTNALDGRIDALEAAPKPVVPIARWVLAVSADLTTSDAPAELADVPTGYTLAAVRVNAATNPSGGGFSFNVTKNGSNVFSAAQAHPANSTTSAAYTGFATSSVSAGDLIGLSLSSTGTGVRHAVVTLFGREV